MITARRRVVALAEHPYTGWTEGSPVSSMSSRPSRRSSCSQAVQGPISSQPRMGGVTHWRTLLTTPVAEMLPTESENHGTSQLSCAVSD
jgi:hypothetical protein